MRLFPLFAFLFLLVPIIEIYFLIQVGSVIGAFPTILLVVGTAVLGGFLLRQQGLSTFRRYQQNLAKGQLPAQEMLEGVLLLIGGVLLMTPGFFTDTLGFLCLLPITRPWIATWLVRRVVTIRPMQNQGYYQGQGTGQRTGYGSHHNAGRSPQDSHIYDGEFTQKAEQHIDQQADNKSQPSSNNDRKYHD
ncbi:MAG TPA: FxsA family protein [Thiothrix sp.]|nr:FxsA family protein [Thiothrix sp.]